MAVAIALPRSGSVVPWLIPACGLVAIAGLSGWIDAPLLGAVCKPLTTLLIALHASRRPSSDSQQRRAVLAGLILSFLGECAMSVPRTFVAGLCLFVLAQCCYLSVSVRAIGLLRPGLIHVVHAMLVGWAVMMWSVRPTAVFAAVVAFMGLLGLTSAQCETWWWRSRGSPGAAVARYAALGGLFWLSADLLWTFSQFVAWVPQTYAFALTGYWLAQWFLASIIGADEVAATPQRAPAGAVLVL